MGVGGGSFVAFSLRKILMQSVREKAPNLLLRARKVGVDSAWSSKGALQTPGEPSLFQNFGNTATTGDTHLAPAYATPDSSSRVSHHGCGRIYLNSRGFACSAVSAEENSAGCVADS